MAILMTSMFRAAVSERLRKMSWQSDRNSTKSQPLRHSRESGNPVRSFRFPMVFWIPAFAGMTRGLFSLKNSERAIPGACPVQRRWRRMAAVCALNLLGILGAAVAVADGYTESEIKAAFLYKFTGFVEWPDSSFPDKDTPFRIGVLGEDPFGKILDDTVRGKKAKNRDILIKRSGDANDLKECHIVFISSSEERRLRTILDEFKKSSALTVGDTEDFAKDGGIINLVAVDNRIGLEVNVDAAKDAKFRISSRLLKLAKIVRGAKGGES